MTAAAAISRRLVEQLPRVLQSGDNLQGVLSALGRELEILDRASLKLMRSRWYDLASDWDQEGLTAPSEEAAFAARGESELGRIGALFGLLPERGESSDAYRERLRRFVLLHRHGLGSSQALLGLAALVYHADDIPQLGWEGECVHARFSCNGTPVTLELEDNPRQARSAEFKAVSPGLELPVVNDGLTDTLPSFELHAIDQALSFPVIEHVESGVRVLYLGSLAKGECLTLAQGRLPLVNGVPGRGEMLVGSGYRFCRHDGCDPPVARFGGELAYFADFSSKLPFPDLATGESHWRYETLSRDRLAYYVAGRSDAKTLLDQAQTQGESPRVALTLLWEQKIPSCFVLRIPADFTPDHLDHFAELTRRLSKALDYGRAAGVQARLQGVIHFRESGLAPDEMGRCRVLHLERDPLSVEDRLLAPRLGFALTEDAAPTEGLYGPDGVYDHSHLNQATFVDESRVDTRGRFDAAHFNARRFVDVFETDEFGRYDEAEYNEKRFDKDEEDKP